MPQNKENAFSKIVLDIFRWSKTGATALPDQPSPPGRLENHLIWVDLTKMIPLWLDAECPLST